MSLSKQEKAKQIAIRDSVISEITERGALTGKELMASLKLGRGLLPSMIKARVLESKYSGKNDDNGNRIMLYALPGKECKRVEVEPGPTLFDLWPVSIPHAVGRPRKIEESHSRSAVGHRGVAIQSSVPALMMYGG